MLSKEEVLKITKLAKLELTDTEVKLMQKDLSGILDYFEILKKIPANKLSSFAKVSEDKQNSNLRKDEVFEQGREVVIKMIESVPNKKDGYVKVKAIL